MGSKSTRKRTKGGMKVASRYIEIYKIDSHRVIRSQKTPTPPPCLEKLDENVSCTGCCQTKHEDGKQDVADEKQDVHDQIVISKKLYHDERVEDKENLVSKQRWMV